MANPNIVEVTSIYGKTAVLLPTTTASDIIVNSAGSGKIYKVNFLTVANVNATAAADITASIYRGAVEYKLASTISVPADASLILISKDTSIYLEEGDSLRLTASINSYLSAVSGYEIIG
jgi:hypothetical protein